MATQSTHFADALPIDDFERKAELRFEFALPLDRYCRRCDISDKLDPAAQEQLPRNVTRLCCLAKIDVIRDQEIDTEQPKRLAQRKQLLGI